MGHRRLHTLSVKLILNSKLLKSIITMLLLLKLLGFHIVLVYLYSFFEVFKSVRSPVCSAHGARYFLLGWDLMFYPSLETVEMEVSTASKLAESKVLTRFHFLEANTALLPRIKFHIRNWLSIAWGWRRHNLLATTSDCTSGCLSSKYTIPSLFKLKPGLLILIPHFPMLLRHLRRPS